MQEDGTSATRTDAKPAEPVKITAPPAAAVTIDAQNPLPEPSFFWRRWISIIICANALVLAWFSAAWLTGGEQWGMLYGLTKLVIYFAALVLTYYFIAPSAAELTNMIQSAKIIGRGLDVAKQGAEHRENRAEREQAAHFSAPASPDSQIPPVVPDGLPGAVSGDDEEDAAPRGRT